MMSTSEGGSSLFGKLLTWVVVAAIAIVVIKLAFFVAGFALRASLFALFTFGPIILLGWLIMTLLRRFARES
jgi:hypothetical protein